MSVSLSEQIQETIRVNEQVNTMLIDSIKDSDQQHTLSKRGGRTVLNQLCHLHNVRLMWLENMNKEAMKTLKPFKKEEEPSKKELKAALEASAKLLSEELCKAAETGKAPKGFKKGVIPFLSYIIAHEAHHRGNILLTLKQCGVKTDAALQYGIWDWNKL